MIADSYIELGFQPQYVDELVKIFRDYAATVEFDTLVVTGTSGLLMGPILAHTSRRWLTVARKTVENSHATNTLEGWTRGKKLVFVDDFIGTGTTFDRVNRMVQHYYKHPWEWVGAFFWASGDNKYKSILELQSKTVWQVKSALNRDQLDENTISIRKKDHEYQIVLASV